MRRKAALILATTVLLLTGCSNTCKINGCESEVYKDGLCQVHYLANEGISALNGLLGGD